jgi:arabinoxylan arabinofuranohydrolase
MNMVYRFLVKIILIGISIDAFADYPIAGYRYIADPGSLVYNGRVYLFCSNDDDNEPAGTSYDMHSIVCVSSSDLKNWTDHGVVFNVPTDASWASKSWAPSVVQRNGKFYLYFGNGGSNIGVAVSDSPTGPYKDPLGKSLLNSNTAGVLPATNLWLFDPMTFIDDDGQAYMYFGGNGQDNMRVIKLNNDMINVNGSAERFTVPYFFEAAWMHKNKGKYYFSYSTNPGNGTRIDYMSSDKPTSGFSYVGVLSGQPPQNNGDNNHQAVFEFKGEWYQAYHNRIVAINAGVPTGFRRNLAIDKIVHQSDGKITQMVNTANGLQQLGYLNPFVRQEAETMSDHKGIETEVCSSGGMNLSFVDNNDFTMVEGVDFGTTGATHFSASVASPNTGGSIEIRTGSSTGTLIGTLTIPNTGGYQTWKTITTTISLTKGVQNLFFVFKGTGGGLFNFDHWKFAYNGPFGGTAHQIPGTIQFEDFDLGGNGIAYMDNTLGSESVPVTNYRTDEDVDIQVSTDVAAGYYVGYTAAGEWLEYTANVASSGKYDIDLRVACNGEGRTLSLQIGTTTIANNLAVPNTGAWQNWQTITLKGIQLTAGTQKLRVTIGSVNYVNLNYIAFKGIVTGVDENKEESVINVYPNPFTNTFSVESTNNSDYQLFNLSGTLIDTGILTAKTTIGDDWPKGIYIMKVYWTQKSITYKIVKE